jgi:hypothetical protein
MSIDTIVQIIIAAVGTILVPCVIYLVKAISRLNETMTRLEERVTSGVEPRIKDCEGDINELYIRTNDHGQRIAVIESKQKNQ